MQKISEFPIKNVCFNDLHYPSLLRQIYDPPALIYTRGAIPKAVPDVFSQQQNEYLFIAMVGSRKMTEYGKLAVEKIISGLENLSVVIVSGLALGTDEYCHQCALKYKLPTIAVLGSGVDDNSIFPTSNRRLAADILESGGAIISEYEPGIKPRAWHFPVRNRIISGLCHGTVVIEADSKSGARITAESARDQFRDVFAVPGSIFSQMSRGCNDLLKDRVQPITSAEDIINEYPILRRTAEKSGTYLNDLTPIQLKIFEAIGTAGGNLEQIAALTKLSISEINSSLTMLEIKNKISAKGNNYYIQNLTSPQKRG